MPTDAKISFSPEKPGDLAAAANLPGPCGIQLARRLSPPGKVSERENARAGQKRLRGERIRKVSAPVARPICERLRPRRPALAAEFPFGFAAFAFDHPPFWRLPEGSRALKRQFSRRLLCAGGNAPGAKSSPSPMRTKGSEFLAFTPFRTRRAVAPPGSCA